jgi:hypothetical protein
LDQHEIAQGGFKALCIDLDIRQLLVDGRVIRVAIRLRLTARSQIAGGSDELADEHRHRGEPLLPIDNIITPTRVFNHDKTAEIVLRLRTILQSRWIKFMKVCNQLSGIHRLPRVGTLKFRNLHLVLAQEHLDATMRN